MKSLAYIQPSNQAANASLMTVQTVRASGASDIIVNTITGAPTKFYASMGAPHTFMNHTTGETITIISEATVKASLLTSIAVKWSSMRSPLVM